MGKFDPLQRHLEGRHGAEIEMSFASIEAIIGGALPKAAARQDWWADKGGPNARQCKAWTDAGFRASLVPGAERVRFLRLGYRIVSRSEGVTLIAKENPSEAEMAEARQAWENLITLLARTAANAAHRLGIELDMDDPEVARDILEATFEGLFLSKPAKRQRSKKMS